MLDGMRRAAKGGIGRFVMAIVMGLIIVSFVIWGIGDMFRGLVSDKVANVGSTVITVNAFQGEFQNLVYQYQRRSKGQFTPAQAHAIGLDSQLLGKMISDAALDERAKSLGLALSDQTIADAARSDPKLQDASGQFSHDLFDQALRDSGLTERAFFLKQRQGYLRQQLEYSLIDGMNAPKALVEALTAAADETRAIDYITLPASAAGEIPAPGDAALKTYFEDRKASYRANEYRAIDVLAVTPATLAKPGEVSDEDARAVYDKDKDSRFAVAEKRDAQQIVFPTEAEAAEAEAKIKAGTSYDEIAKDRKLTQSDLDLGLVTKADIFDPAIGDAAFALSEGGVSEVVKGKFGYFILRVTKLLPGSVKPFAEVADQLKKEIAIERASNDVLTVHDKIEDLRVSGKSLSEAAKSVGLETRAIAAVDEHGLDPSGAKVDLPEKEALLRAVFASDVGVDDAALNTKDRGFVWFDITKVDPAHDRSFEDVKDEVEKQWRQDEIAKALSAKASDLVKQLDAGATVESVAKGLALEVKSVSGVKRSGAEGLPESVAVAVFALPLDKAGSAQTPDGRVVFKITKDETPPFDPAAPGLKAESDKLTDGLQSGVVEQYLDALKTQLGVTIHQQALQMAEGG